MRKIYIIFRRLHTPDDHYWNDRKYLVGPAFEDVLEAARAAVLYDDDIKKKMLSGVRLYDVTHEIEEVELK